MSNYREFVECESVSLGEMINTDYPGQTWVVEGLIPSDGITMIYGAPGVYKTRLTIDMMLSAASGSSWLGKFTTEPSGILYIDEENGPALLKQQFEQLGATVNLPIRIRSRQNFTITEENMEAVLEDCQTHELNVVVFDPFAYIHDGNENDAGDMSRTTKLFQILTNENIAVIFLHHSRKPGPNGSDGRYAVRGSSALMGAADSAIELTLEKDTLCLEQYKNRRSSNKWAFTLDVSGDENSLTFGYGQATRGAAKEDELIESTCSKIVELLGKGRMMQAELQAKVKEATGAADRTLLYKVLPSLERRKTIAWERGIGKAKIWYLLDNPNNDEADTKMPEPEAVDGDDFAAAYLEEMLEEQERLERSS